MPPRVRTVSRSIYKNWKRCWSDDCCCWCGALPRSWCTLFYFVLLLLSDLGSGHTLDAVENPNMQPNVPNVVASGARFIVLYWASECVCARCVYFISVWIVSFEMVATCDSCMSVGAHVCHLIHEILLFFSFCTLRPAARHELYYIIIIIVELITDYIYGFFLVRLSFGVCFGCATPHQTCVQITVAKQIIYYLICSWHWNGIERMGNPCKSLAAQPTREWSGTGAPIKIGINYP